MQTVVLQAHPLKGVTLDCDLTSAARFMIARGISSLGVFSHDGHDLLGVLTEKDITRSVGEGEDPSHVRVQDVMTTELVSARGQVSLMEARELMKANKIRHLIVEEDGVNHIVSLRDLLGGLT
jgi:CBS domain-containing protein